MAQGCATTQAVDDHVAEIDALAKVARNGDPVALSRLVVQVRPHIVRYCARRLDASTSVHSAEDVAQEVLIAVISALPTLRNESSFLPFVYGIASRKVSDAYRSMSTSRRYLLVVTDVPDAPDPTSDPEAAALRAELSDDLRRRMCRLPHAQQSVLMLRVVAGYSAPEAARELGTTAGAVRIMQHRALATLRCDRSVEAAAS